MLSDTEDQTSRSPMAVRRGRRSGRARAKILRNEVDVGTDPSAFREIEDRRKRKRMVHNVGARVARLVAKNRPPAYVGQGGYRLLAEGCVKVS
jgi:hypothetical protein